MSEQEPFHLVMDVYNVNGVFIKREEKSFRYSSEMSDYWNKNRKPTYRKTKVVDEKATN